MVKVRIGKNGKSTEFSNPLLNVKAHFGSFSLLVDSKREIIPLSLSGEPVEPLKDTELYTIELVSQRDAKQIEEAKYQSKKLFKEKQIEKLKAIIMENDPTKTLDDNNLLSEIEELRRERLKIAKKQKKERKAREKAALQEEDEPFCLSLYNFFCCRFEWKEQDEANEGLLDSFEVSQKGHG